jgi:hypothetical protein
MARVGRDLKRRVRQHALDHDAEIQDVIVRALEDYLKKHSA